MMPVFQYVIYIPKLDRYVSLKHIRDGTIYLLPKGCADKDRMRTFKSQIYARQWGSEFIEIPFEVIPIAAIPQGVV